MLKNVIFTFVLEVSTSGFSGESRLCPISYSGSIHHCLNGGLHLAARKRSSLAKQLDTLFNETKQFELIDSTLSVSW